MTTPNSAPDLLTSLVDIFHALASELHVALPAKVVKFNPPLADVQPTLIRVFEDEDENEVPTEYPVITNVPVAFPRGGGGFLTFPLKEGDPVLLVFAQRSLDAWLETDGKTPIDPGDARRHHLSDAVAFAGLSTTRNAIPNIHAEDVVLGLEDGSAELHIEPGGNTYLKTPKMMIGSKGASKALAIAQALRDELDDIRTVLTNHTHLGNMGAPTSPMAALGHILAPIKNFFSTRLYTDA